MGNYILISIWCRNFRSFRVADPRFSQRTGTHWNGGNAGTVGAREGWKPVRPFPESWRKKNLFLGNTFFFFTHRCLRRKAIDFTGIAKSGEIFADSEDSMIERGERKIARDNRWPSSNHYHNLYDAISPGEVLSQAKVSAVNSSATGEGGREEETGRAGSAKFAFVPQKGSLRSFSRWYHVINRRNRKFSDRKSTGRYHNWKMGKFSAGGAPRLLGPRRAEEEGTFDFLLLEDN